MMIRCWIRGKLPTSFSIFPVYHNYPTLFKSFLLPLRIFWIFWTKFLPSPIFSQVFISWFHNSFSRGVRKQSFFIPAISLEFATQNPLQALNELEWKVCTSPECILNFIKRMSSIQHTPRSLYHSYYALMAFCHSGMRGHLP